MALLDQTLLGSINPFWCDLVLQDPTTSAIMAIITRNLLVILSIASLGHTKYMEGELNTGDNWAFLSRFCFLSLRGKFEYDVEYPEVSSVEPEQVYQDEFRHLPRRTWTCTTTLWRSGPGCTGTTPTSPRAGRRRVCCRWWQTLCWCLIIRECSSIMLAGFLQVWIPTLYQHRSWVKTLDY